MNTINTRLAVIDALAWPIGIFAFLVVKSDFHVGGGHGLAMVVLGIWTMRKLGWALDGYRDETWYVNPLNPFAVVLALLLRQQGPYNYTTTTVLVWGLSIFAVSCVIKLFS